MLKPENIAIIGGGAIGTAFAEELIIKYPDSKINIFSRKSVNSFFKSNVDRWEVQLYRLFLHLRAAKVSG